MIPPVPSTMVDSTLIYKHLETQNELRELENRDEKRKSLIRLAVLRVIALNKVAEHKPQTDEMEHLVTKNHEYQVIIDKIKQEHSTKEKLQASKIETMKEEITKLKLQLKANTITPSASSGGYSSGLQWLRNQESLHSSTLNSRLKLKYNEGVSSSALSPTYPTSLQNVSDNSSVILTPLRKKKFPIPTTKREYTNYNTLRKKIEEKMNNPGTTIPLSKSTPIKDNTPEKLETRTNSFSKRAESTPISNKIEPERDISSANTSRNTSLVSATDDDTFASANSSLGSVKSVESTKSEKKKKRLKLWKSEATKVTLESEKRENDNLDDVNMNSVAYYQDSNFLPESSPSRKPQKRGSDEVTPAPSNVKRKKNIFKID